MAISGTGFGGSNERRKAMKKFKPSLFHLVACLFIGAFIAVGCGSLKTGSVKVCNEHGCVSGGFDTNGHLDVIVEPK